jgi:hypothetical protein
MLPSQDLKGQIILELCTERQKLSIRMVAVMEQSCKHSVWSKRNMSKFYLNTFLCVLPFGRGIGKTFKDIQ